jgi:hypothetical protein
MKRVAGGERREAGGSSRGVAEAQEGHLIGGQRPLQPPFALRAFRNVAPDLTRLHHWPVLVEALGGTLAQCCTRRNIRKLQISGSSTVPPFWHDPTQ